MPIPPKPPPEADGDKRMERAKGIEPSYEAWEASVLPLNYARAVASLAQASFSEKHRAAHLRNNHDLRR